MITIRKKVLFDSKDVTNHITSLDIYKEVGKLVSSLSLSAQNVKAPEVIEVYIKKENEEKSYTFYPTQIQKEQNVHTIIAKSKMSFFTEDLGQKEDIGIAGSAKEVLTALTEGLNTDFTNFTDYNLLDGGYYNTTYRASAILDILSAVSADVYIKNNTLYFAEKIYIHEDTNILFDESDFLSFKVSSTPSKAKSVTFNQSVNKIYSTPTLSLNVTPSPQPLSPSHPLTIKDDSDKEDIKTYVIKPTPALARLFFSPLNAYVSIAGATFKKRVNQKAIEGASMNGEYYLTVSGGIKSIKLIRLNDRAISGYSFKSGYNVVYFNRPITGNLQIAYITDIYQKIFPTSQDSRKKIQIDIKMLNQSLSYTHTYTASGYYPLPYYFEINFITDWGIDPNRAGRKGFSVYKVLSKTKDKPGGNYVTRSDEFGDASITLTSYGIYKLKTSGYKPLYITFYINSFSISMTPIYPEEKTTSSESSSSGSSSSGSSTPGGDTGISWGVPVSQPSTNLQPITIGDGDSHLIIG